jgi:hypothetical protein
VLFVRRNISKWDLAIEAEAAVSEEILDPERCTKQFVLNVIKNVKYHSNLQKESLFIAEIAS